MEKRYYANGTILGGGRQVGKSHRLVRESITRQVPILCVSVSHKQHLKMIANLYKHSYGEMPEPITAHEWKEGTREILVDDVEGVLSAILKSEVSLVSTSYEYEEMYLPQRV